MSCLTVASFESDMVWQGGLSGHGRLSEDSKDSEGIQVRGLDGAALCSGSLCWAEGELVSDGVISKREELE